MSHSSPGFLPSVPLLRGHHGSRRPLRAICRPSLSPSPSLHPVPGFPPASPSPTCIAADPDADPIDQPVNPSSRKPAPDPKAAAKESRAEDVLPSLVDDMEQGPVTEAEIEIDNQSDAAADPVVPASTPKTTSATTPSADDAAAASNDDDDASEEAPPVSKPPAGASVKVELSADEMEKAKAARAAAEKSAEESAAATAARNKKIRDALTTFFTLAGDKTRAVSLGQEARERAETFVSSQLQLSESDSATQQDKLRSSAAAAAKSVVASLVSVWEARAVPFVLKQFPDEFNDLSSRTIASLTLAASLTLFLLPSLFSGPASKPKTPEAKKLDSETAQLEKKLSSKRSASSSSKSVFPPDQPPSTAPPVKSSARTSTLPTSPAPKPTPVQPVVPPPVVPVPKPTPAPAEKPVSIKDVTSEMAMSAVSKKLGINSNYVLGVTFDSLNAEPTVVLQVSETYHKLPDNERRRLAELSLQACRTLGYERVNLVEEVTGRQVAHAGITIDLESEAANLRADMSSMRKLSDRLAIQAADNEMEIASLKERLELERGEFDRKLSNMEQISEGVRKDNTALAEDLAEAREEIARIPDSMEMEQRTLEAEDLSRQMRETVDVLSKQLVTAKEAEMGAKEAAVVAAKAVEVAQTERDSGIAEVRKTADMEMKLAEKKAAEKVAAAESRVKELKEEMGIREEEGLKRMEKAVGDTRKEMQVIVDETEGKRKGIEESLKKQEKESEGKLAKMKEGYEKEMGGVQKRYESLLEEVEKKGKAELDAAKKESEERVRELEKESKMRVGEVSKERDEMRKEVEKAEGREKKATAAAEKEREKLKQEIGKLEEKLKTKEAKDVAEVETKKMEMKTEEEKTVEKTVEKTAGQDKEEGNAEESSLQESTKKTSRFASWKSKLGSGRKSGAVVVDPETDKN